MIIFVRVLIGGEVSRIMMGHYNFGKNYSLELHKNKVPRDFDTLHVNSNTHFIYPHPVR